ncbi:uncharacterized protein LOC105838150 isoform X2 [Monomorium pharaonis]|uniref:uncharacterized protein LOC105838150 isoform X2 n=1 Tax=Monomorium pharaonis TaxID=307658 RepID=UPI001745E83C|nr:uncharacterized protein LOC105838150 isoform X2 [Monomorium pharaonis]
MHFWINKPAGRYYGFTGRRYPVTPVPKSHNQCRRGGELSQMASPVHFRLTQVRYHDNLATRNLSPAGPSNINNPHRGIARSTARIHNNRHHNSSSLSAAQLNNIPNNVTNANNNQLILSNTTSANGTEQNRSLLTGNVFDLREAELAGFRLRCGIWSTFALATVFVAAAKFYFGYRGPGLEILVFCGLLILLLSACLYSIFCKYNRDRNYHPSSRSEHNAQMQEDHIVAVTNASSIGDSVVNTTTTTVPTTTVRQNPPPPYHIAILIPPSSPPSSPPLVSSEEASPPSYDKACDEIRRPDIKFN